MKRKLLSWIIHPGKKATKANVLKYALTSYLKDGNGDEDGNTYNY